MERRYITKQNLFNWMMSYPKNEISELVLKMCLINYGYDIEIEEEVENGEIESEYT